MSNSFFTLLKPKKNQKWYVFQVCKEKISSYQHRFYEELSILLLAVEWFEIYGRGNYFVKPLCLGKCKLGYYEFESEDKETDMSLRGTPYSPLQVYLCIMII